MHSRIIWACRQVGDYRACHDAVAAIHSGARKILAVTEDCLCGMVFSSPIICKITIKINIFFILFLVESEFKLPVPGMVIWFDNPSFALLFFRERFFYNVRRIYWLYRNAHLEKTVIAGMVALYHTIRISSISLFL